ncbi:MAG: hypothetical protein OEU68_11595 [Nitrospira sp.]|jgi:hypothetical protein|nr:hypothetical protein [Nitrospira sp.]MDH4243639.1 hypothetical protein [Nitrospira sp.]MDH4357922.1 hypothetical protein [Nitrospira sp.]MDH5320780.1 hypothetical protein [Nitrospira sp.]
MRFRTILTVSAVITVSIATGCSGAKVVTKSTPELSQYQIRSIALLPFTAIATPQARDQEDFFLPVPDSVRRSAISMGVPPEADSLPKKTLAVPGYAAEKVTELFWGRLQDWKGVRVLAPGESARVTLGNSEGLKKTPEQAAAQAAKRLNVDAALLGLVSAYRERVGSRLGADPPASVGFQVSVVAADGQVLWVGKYYERQRPMNEDLIGFLQRWAFVTAGELAEYGVDEVLKEFPFGRGEQ